MFVTEESRLRFQSPVEYRPRRTYLVATAVATALVCGIGIFATVENPINGMVRAHESSGPGNCSRALHYYSLTPLQAGDVVTSEAGNELRIGQPLGQSADGNRVSCVSTPVASPAGASEPVAVEMLGEPVPLWRTLLPEDL